jgi:hypothetical protein
VDKEAFDPIVKSVVVLSIFLYEAELLMNAVAYFKGCIRSFASIHGNLSIYILRFRQVFGHLNCRVNPAVH